MSTRQTMRRGRWVLAACLVWPALLARGDGSAPAPAPTAWSGPFFYMQMSDPQFGFFDNNKGSLARETELFAQAVAAANRLKPAFVIVTGDLINKAGDAAQEKEFLRIAGTLDKTIPLHLVAGNHDVDNVPTEASLKHYREVFGRDWYSFARGGCHFIVLNSVIVHSPARSAAAMAEQLAWLKDDLARAAAAHPRHIIVFLHHPFFLEQPDEKDSYTVIPAARRKEYLDLFKRYGVLAVFAGHYHRNAAGRDGDLEMITTGPVGKPLGKDPSGLRIVKVFADRLEHEYLALDKLPPTVALSPLAPATQPAGR